MKQILIREVDDDFVDLLDREAKRHRRSREKHALFLIERGLGHRPLETAGELLEALEEAPAPNLVSEQQIEKILEQRGRRSNRPATP